MIRPMPTYPRALCLDQSSTVTGFAIVELTPLQELSRLSVGVKGRILGHGRIILPKSTDLVGRMEVLRADLEALIVANRITVMVLEDYRSIRQRHSGTAMALNSVLFICRSLAKKYALPTVWQHPSRMKNIVTGKGNADKGEVARWLVKILGIPPWEIKDDNHADALGHAFMYAFNQSQKVG